jgi:hypothetical protein
MPFPESEWPSLKRRLELGKRIVTTRILAEQGKYEPGMQVQTPFWDAALTISKVDTFDDIEKHPYREELTASQKRQIGRNRFDVIELNS